MKTLDCVKAFALNASVQRTTLARELARELEALRELERQGLELQGLAELATLARDLGVCR